MPAVNDNSRSTLIPIFKILREHALAGEVKALVHSDQPKNLLDYKNVVSEDGRHNLVVEKVRIVPGQNHVVIKFAGIEHINDLPAFLGKTFCITNQQLKDVELSEDDDEAFYIKDLIGLNVFDIEDIVKTNPIGKVLAVDNFGAGSILTIEMTDETDVMLPFIDSFFPTVDLKERFMIMQKAEFVNGSL